MGKKTLLKDLSHTQETSDKLASLITQRFTNFAMACQDGHSPTQVLLSEIVVLENKVDALMQMLEDKVDFNFTMLDAYIGQAAESGIKGALAVRQDMQMHRGPQLVRPNGKPI